MNSVVRWLPASGLLAVVALALTGLIAPPPPIAGAPVAEIVACYARHHASLEIESIADGCGAMLPVIFAATFHARLRSTNSAGVRRELEADPGRLEYRTGAGRYLD